MKIVLHIFCCSLFHLVAFFTPHAIGLNLFFKVFQHRPCLPSLCMSLLLGVSLCMFLNLHYICYQFFLGIKTTIELDSCRWLQKHHFVVFNTFCVYVKCKCIKKDFMVSSVTAYIRVEVRSASLTQMTHWPGFNLNVTQFN